MTLSLRRIGPLLWLMLAVTCASHEPGGQRAPSVAAKSAARESSTAPTQVSADAAAPLALTLDNFAPLLARPELATAKSALELQGPLQAAKEVEKYRTGAASAGPRFDYLAARLYEQGSDMAAALAAYSRVEASDSLLVPYARLAAARILVRLEKPELALARLTAVAPLPALEAARARLRSQIAMKASDFRLAATESRTYLAQPLSSEQTDQGRVDLAAALLEMGTAESEPAGKLASLTEALELARLGALAVDATVVASAKQIETAVLSQLSPADRAAHALVEPSVVLEQLSRLVDGRKFEDAERLSGELSARVRLGDSEKLRCETALLRAKALTGLKEWGKAADVLTAPVEACRQDPDLGARVLFAAAKYSAADARNARAVTLYARLEAQYPTHRLADDARLGAALAELKLGNEARFTELLSDMLSVYPNGDVSLDGVFELIVRRIERRDWSGAANLLERVMTTYSDDAARGTEISGRERYFHARALLEMGEKERGLNELEALVKDVPLSYYMLHAYSRLRIADPLRAEAAVAAGRKRATEEPFSFEPRPELREPAFQRAMELFCVGDIEQGRKELDIAGLTERGAAPQVLWGVSLLYGKAGLDKDAHTVARGLLSDWLHRWPAGDWVQTWQLAFPRPFSTLVAKEAKRSQITESLVYAVMREESSFDPSAESPASAYGLMQLIVPTARRMAGPLGLPSSPSALKQPSVNIALGARTLSTLVASFDTNPILAIPGYNAGPGRPRRWLKERPQVDLDVWIELIPIRETRRYMKRVLASRAAYAAIYYPQDVEGAFALPERLTL